MSDAPVSIKLGPRTYTLRPSYEAYMAVEEALGASLAEIYAAHVHGRLQLMEMAQIIAAGANAGGETFRVEDVAKRLYEQSAQDGGLARIIAQYLLALGWSPEDAKKKFAGEWALTPDQAEASSPI